MHGVRVLTIGEVAQRSGVATSALRFYEERGLIRSERTPAGHRNYQRPVIRRVAFIVFAQRVGLTLSEVQSELAKLPENRVPKRADWAKLSRSWSARIDERIADLERLRAGLTECIGCGCLSLDRCKLANPNDQARARASGPGPRYLLGDRRRYASTRRGGQATQKYQRGYNRETWRLGGGRSFASSPPERARARDHRSARIDWEAGRCVACRYPHAASP